MMLLKKTVYDKLLTKANPNSNNGLKTQNNTNKSALDKKIDDANKKSLNTSDLITKQIITQKLLR